MRTLSICVLMVFGLLNGAHAGEAMLRNVYQPLDGLGAGGPIVMAVPYVQYHYDMWHGMDKITGAWIPLTDSPKPLDSINLAAKSGLVLEFEELDVNPQRIRVIIDCTKITTDEPGGYPLNEVFDATLECLRLMIPPQPVQVEFTIRTRPTGQEKLAERFEQFQKNSRDQVFYKAE